MTHEENWAVAVVLTARGDMAQLDASLRSVLVSIDVAENAGRLAPDGAVVVIVHDALDRHVGAAARQLLVGAGVRSVVLAVDGTDPGSSRRRGTDAALAELSDQRMHRCWFANADAGTRVPPTWLLRHLDAARQGAAAVAGPLAPGPTTPPRALGRRRTPSIVAGTAGTIEGPVGPNLGVRGDAYLAAGGWADDGGAVEAGLWQRVRALGRPVVSDGSGTAPLDHPSSRHGGCTSPPGVPSYG